jgi:hypothetical protein
MKKKTSKKDNRKAGKLIYWTPRILSILFLVFLALFSLDVFDEKLTFGQTMLALLMHNIPTLILLAIVFISWKYEIIGGIAFILAGLFYITMRATSKSFEWYMISWIAIIAGPAFLIGALFLVNWFKKKQDMLITKDKHH